LPAGVTQAAYDAAQTACRDKLPTGAFGGGRGGQGGAGSPAIQAYLSCLKDHGVQVPTTVAGQPGGGGMGAIDRNSPAFQSANATCSALLPANPAGSTTTVPGA
jgi:hypothetical protein